jgi:DNA polymerase zeta
MVQNKHLHYTGRIILNVWRLLRGEVALTSYTFENTSFHVLHERVPLFSLEQLFTWFAQRNTR